MLGSPAAAVGLSRTVLLPAASDTVSVLVTQVDQAPVPSKDGVCTVVPLTTSEAARAAAVPLAKRTFSVAVPAVAAFTVNWTEPLVALVPLQNPLPEKPVQSESMVPEQTAGEVSAS